MTTIRIYAWGVESLLRHVRKGDGRLNRQSLETWERDVLAGLNPRSRALAATGVRQCLMWAADKGEVDYRLAHAVPSIKYPPTDRPATLTATALLKIEAYLQTQAEENPKSLRRLRDRALYFYIKSTAANVNEILQARRKTFRAQLVQQRGGRPKELTPPDGVANLIHEYLRLRTDDNPYLWIGWHGNDHFQPNRLADDGVLKILRRLAKVARVPAFTPRELRNTAITLLVERGHDDKDVMEYIGHRDVRSLQRYKEVVQDKQARLRADLDVPL